ncbi:hypothetical protein [Rhodococcus sp. IEGM 1307]|uniref:hypothetical protein n=1 Tax=Rhodococcus sp. IEGM 1307 TaxID=3047091 RepID=UPI0024B6F0C3|nr:hypothetical protein [Rhodococcus sp. IEGM 1307]MDI9979351.1 hypothetical protein [Rhodococcus sp. IEGM 1307]
MHYMEDRWTYDEWQEHLADAYLSPAKCRGPITLFADDGELRRRFDAAQSDPVRSLSRAVVSAFNFRKPDELFESIRLKTMSWRKGARITPPPTLPLLALSVLAATRMKWDAKFSPNAYYPRFVELVEQGGQSVDAGQLKSSFDDVPAMWEGLVNWVDEQPGDFGPLTARNHNQFTQIGYSLSQAVIRGSDRARMTSFFEAIELDSDAVPSAVQLLRALRLWCTRDRGFTRGFSKVLDSQLAEDLIVPSLMGMATTWDGNVLATGGRRWMPFLLTVDLDAWECTWELGTRKELQSDTLTFSDGTVVDIAWPDYGDLYTLSAPLPTVAGSIRERFTAEGNNAFALHKPKEIYVLANDPRAGKWVEVQGIEPYAEHVLVVAASRKAEVETILRAGAERGWAPVLQRHENALIPRLLIYRNVVFSDQEAFESVIGALDPSLTNQLRPDHPPVPRLVNGLRLPVPLARNNHYIAGGEPDLLLPVGTEPRHVDASLDGVVQAERLRTSDFPIKLRAKVPLTPGRYELVVDGHRLVFHICAGTPEIGEVLANRELADLEPWTDSVTADAPSSPTLVAPGGRTEVWTIDFTGHAERVEDPDTPEWLAESGLAPPYRYEPRLSARDVWIVRVLGQHVRSIDRVALHTPNFRDLNRESKALWALIERSGLGESDFFLALYLKAWTKWGSHGR